MKGTSRNGNVKGLSSLRGGCMMMYARLSCVKKKVSWNLGEAGRQAGKKTPFSFLFSLLFMV